MATQKKKAKVRNKKYNPNSYKRKLEIMDYKFNLLFDPLFLFFKKLKAGKAEIQESQEYGNIVVCKFFGGVFPVFMVLQKWCGFVHFILKQRKIYLDYSPLIEFAGLLVNRKDDLYFESFEIQNALNFVSKVYNIFIKEVTANDIYNSSLDLELVDAFLESGDMKESPLKMKYTLDNIQ